MRRQTTAAQKDRSHVINKIVAYLLQTRRFSKKFEYIPASIIAMDETAMSADMKASTTVGTTRKKEVSLKNTGHEKVRISLLECKRRWNKTQTLYSIWWSET